MSKRIDNFIIRQPDGSVRFANSLVVGGGLQVTDTAGGVPELVGRVGEVFIRSSGKDDTAAIQDALDTPGVARVRLGAGGFKVSSPITLKSDQVITGRGEAWTEVTATHSGSTFILGAENSGIESLRVWDTTYAGTTVEGSGANLWVDHVQIGTVGYGVKLSGSRLAVRDVEVAGSDYVGIVIENASDVVLSDVALLGSGGHLILMTQVDNLRMTEVMGKDGADGIVLDGGSGYVIRGVKLSNCPGFSANLINRISVTDALMENGAGFGIGNSRDVSVDAVRVTGSSMSFQTVTDLSLAASSSPHLSIQNCHSAVINGFTAELPTTGAAYPHVVVGGGSTLVFFGSIRKVGGVASAPYELDVSGAGGRVLFAQQNFNPAKINSGGKFVAL